MNTRRLALHSVSGLLVGAAIGSALALGRGSDYAFFDPLIDVKSIIDHRYVEAPDLRAMQEGAIRGMVEALDDPYTVYVPADDRREFDKRLTGDYVGIGIQIFVGAEGPVVVSPLEDSPAFKAGIAAGDRIVEVNGTSTAGLSGDECVDLLSGAPGSTVTLVVERGEERIPFTVTRERIVTRTVKGVHWSPGNGHDGAQRWDHLIDAQRRIAYIRLTQFTPSSAEELHRTLAGLGAEEGRLGGLILDLRWNPGGVLGEAIAIADLFLDEGVIVSTRGRAVPEEVARAKADGTLPDFPLVVLINGQSASASEVLAGALVENGRAIAIGTRTFGKGSVQSVISLPSGNGAQLKITDQLYYLPSGRCLHRTDESPEWGVDPTDGFYVPLTDEQAAQAIRIRGDEEIIRAAAAAARAGDADWSNPDSILEHLKDPQLAAAVRSLQARLDTGEWKPTGEPLADGAELARDDLRRAELLRERLLRELDRVDRRIERLHVAAAEGAARPAHDLWPDDLDLTGGRLIVEDPRGQTVATLRITGADLERWLIDAGVTPEPAPEPAGERDEPAAE